MLLDWEDMYTTLMYCRIHARHKVNKKTNKCMHAGAATLLREVIILYDVVGGKC